MQGTISRRLWAKAGAERIPLTGAFELLPICNFACKMCYVRKSRAEQENAGTEVLKDEDFNDEVLEDEEEEQE